MAVKRRLYPNDVNQKTKNINKMEEAELKLAKQCNNACDSGGTDPLSLHVHDDIQCAADWFNIPLAWWSIDDVYIMQQDRCVFVGNRKAARSFFERNNGEYCKSIFQSNTKPKQ